MRGTLPSSTAARPLTGREGVAGKKTLAHPGRHTPQDRGAQAAETACGKPVAHGGGGAYYRAMPLADPNNPDRALSVAEVRALLDRGRAEAAAGQGTDLELLLAQWDAEDAADHPTRRTGKSSVA
jgi:hypothetical protein